MRVLVADDSRTMRRMIIKHLNQIGINDIVQAGNGREALEKLIKSHREHAKIDLILTDWNMPMMTGLDFVKAVRAQENLKKVPIIMITTNSTKNDVLEAVDSGIDNYVSKPFSTEILRGKIIETLKKFFDM